MTTTRDDSEALSPFPANAKLHGEERQTVEDAVAAAPLPIVVNTLLDAGAARGVVTAFAPMTCLICIICAVAHRRCRGNACHFEHVTAVTALDAAKLKFC